jgi:ribosome-binding factor A
MNDNALKFAVRARPSRRSGDGSRGGAGQRQRRVGEALRHRLAEIFRSDESRDPVLRAANITVSEVRVSPDLRHATVYVMPLGGAYATEIMAALTRSTGFLRGLVSRELALRYAPRLSFELDRSFDQADRISALLARTDVARDLEPAPADTSDPATGNGEDAG